jgi:sugar phosphate isomerase/epimerase
LFEQVEPMLAVLAEIDRSNFGLIYEPANLLICGEPYGLEALRKLRPHLMNVYIQNHRLDPNGSASIPTFCRGEVRFQPLDPWAPGGVDAEAVGDALRAVGYGGWFTIHQAQGIRTATAAREFADRCAVFFRQALRLCSAE